MFLWNSGSANNLSSGEDSPVPPVPVPLLGCRHFLNAASHWPLQFFCKANTSHGLCLLSLPYIELHSLCKCSVKFRDCVYHTPYKSHNTLNINLVLVEVKREEESLKASGASFIPPSKVMDIIIEHQNPT